MKTTAVKKVILVPTDFSPASENAAEYAAELAKKIHAKITLLHVYHTPVPVSEYPILEVDFDELQKINNDVLRKKALALHKKMGIEVDFLAIMGMAVEEILNQEKNCVLIVMGMHDAGKMSETFIGSITTSTLRKAKTPVMVIPEDITYKEPKNIAFACDYNNTTDVHALEHLKFFSKTFHSKLFVVNVKHKDELITIDESLTGIELDDELRGIDHAFRFTENEDLVAGINEFVKDNKIDLVAMIPHRYNLIERIFHKSIAKKLAFHSHVPILSLPDSHKSVPIYFM